MKKEEAVEVQETPIVKTENIRRETIGKTVQGRPIESVSFGTGEKNLLLVGGIHGGYEWNSVLLAYQFIDYFSANENVIPENITVTVIPSLNPDGVFDVISKEGRFTVADVSNSTSTAVGRFNANSVDLNRNFDCKWKPESMWKGNVVDAGTFPFSEPEARAFRDFALKIKPISVVFWHSQSNAVYASSCTNGILPGTASMMKVYGLASGYPAIDTFDAYEVTGAAEDWLATIGIPAVTVELKTHETIEWDKNLAGVKALLELYK